MNDFFVRLLLIELRNTGFDGAKYEETLGQIVISPQDGDSFSTFIIVYEDEEHLIRYHSEDHAVVQKARRALDTVIAIVAAWEQAPPMGVGKFRKLAEWNGVVLAARDDGGRGLHLVTWRYNRETDSATNGNYTTNIGGALLDFIKRSGIIPRARVLDNERLAEVRAALGYRLEHDEGLSIGDKEKIFSIIEDLEEEANGSV